ncbi:MAG: VWA domain-containing protein [Flavobacteriales bacterium]|nr:VWA domain-containing protein [Flavobacteriales bacterium]
MTFAYPAFLYGLIVIPLLAARYLFISDNDTPDLKTSSIAQFENKTLIKPILRHGLFVFRCIAIGSLIIALARPQSSSSWIEESIEGIDIIISMDISSSMLAMDLSPNRLEASKNVAMDFIANRPNDRIGLVIFSGESFTQCPLTSDHAVLINLFNDIKTGIIEDGTAIGLGLATSVSRLKDSDAKSKVIILLTDGENNRGSVTPLTAADIAAAFDIRVYTIGVGTTGKAKSPVARRRDGTLIYEMMDVKIDEKTLQEISAHTDGKYFRATDNSKLAEIYEQIDALEKTKIQENNYKSTKEEYFPFAVCALAIFLLEILLRNTYFRSIP